MGFYKWPWLITWVLVNDAHSPLNFFFQKASHVLNFRKLPTPQRPRERRFSMGNPNGFPEGVSIKVSNLTTDLRLFDLSGSKNRGTPKWMVYNGKPY